MANEVNWVAVLAAPSITASITTVGWLIAYWLNVRAQRRVLINTVTDRARVETVQSLRSYQDWLGDIAKGAYDVEAYRGIGPYAPRPDWPRIAARLAKVFWEDKRSTEWMVRLDEYELIFPTTRACRLTLQERHQAGLNELLSQYSQAVMEGFVKPEAAAISDQLGELRLEQLALIEYLIVCLQNLSLGKLLGQSRPIPEPLVAGLLTIQADKSGMLQIVPREGPGACPVCRKPVSGVRVSDGMTHVYQHGDGTACTEPYASG